MEECHLGHFYKGEGDCILWPRLTSRVFWFLTKKSVHFLVISWKDAGIKLKLCDLMWSRSWRRECSCHVNNEWPVAWMQKCVINLLKCNAEVLILILKSDKSHIFNIYICIYISLCFLVIIIMIMQKKNHLTIFVVVWQNTVKGSRAWESSEKQTNREGIHK